MSLPSIAVINFSEVSDQHLQRAIRAVNQQMTDDFVPLWGTGRSLRLHASPWGQGEIDQLSEDPVRADSVIYIVNEASLPDALGYHSINTQGVPIGFVFVMDTDDWTVTLSHEALELVIDPSANIFVPGPDPRNPGNVVLHAYESCDAVERTSYLIDDIRVSNFQTPSYFTIDDEPGTRNDFLGVGVTSFGVTRGSHIAFFDLAANEWVTHFGERDSPLSMQAARAKKFDYPKPERPSEEQLCDCIRQYNEETCKKHKKLRELRHLPAITRTGRYEAAARKFAVKAAV